MKHKALHYALLFGNLSRSCFNQMQKVDASNNGRTIALLYAAKCDHTDAMKTLLQGGSDTNATDKGAKSALVYAVERGHTGAMMGRRQCH